LGFPERIETTVTPLDMFKVGRLDFEAPDFERFPCLGLAYRALESGGNMPAVLNAANEVAVESFLGSRMPFTAIPEMIGDVMQRVGRKDIATLSDVLAADAVAREAAHEWLACFA